MLTYVSPYGNTLVSSCATGWRSSGALRRGSRPLQEEPLMPITRNPDSEPRKPVRGTLADVTAEGGDVRESSEMRGDPEQREPPRPEPDVERTEDIKR